MRKKKFSLRKKKEMTEKKKKEEEEEGRRRRKKKKNTINNVKKKEDEKKKKKTKEEEEYDKQCSIFNRENTRVSRFHRDKFRKTSLGGGSNTDYSTKQNKTNTESSQAQIVL
ncbi:hypothetical protein M8J77_013085 [Diaphorina citri]|nr:hypothetical protein M8J77_013085 [Diaphorina citri]